MTEVRRFNLCLASDWEYDREFLKLLEEAAREHSLSTYSVWPWNLEETYQGLKEGCLDFDFFFDRSSEFSPEFLRFHELMVEKNIPIFESHEKLRWASDKATMHPEFIASGIHTPYTIILPPYRETEEVCLSLSDLSHLGRPFVIKPANTTGGGMGVVDGAETLQDVLLARMELKQDKYLLQEKIRPLVEGERRFWFRGFYSCGHVQVTWWNDVTHVYQEISEEDVRRYHLEEAYSLVGKIAAVCRLRFFSTEIALNRNKSLVVIDYVNEACDMRLQSIHQGGVPDRVVWNIVCQIAAYIGDQVQNTPRYSI